ncbi:MAG: hypothetical protein LBK67_00605, partial [Coriobacteriales bacterium]|nr:hypothetical protein [Coriobacteriales bacterium]
RKSGFATSGIADPRSTRCCVFPDRATCVPSCCGYFENLPAIFGGFWLFGSSIQNLDVISGNF